MSNAVSPYIFPGTFQILPPATDKELLHFIRLSDICYVVCNRTGVALEDIKAGDTRRHIAEARQIIYYLTQSLTNLSLQKITMALHDNSRYAKVTGGIDKIKNNMAADAEFTKMINRMKLELQTINNLQYINLNQKAA